MDSLEERIRRLDEVFKLSLTILTISLSFGISFFGNLGAQFFASIFTTFLISLSIWAIGHLRGGELGLFFKLISWWFFSQITPAILVIYLIPIRPTPPYIGVPILFVGFLIYLAIHRYLRNGLEERTRKMTIYIPFVFVIIYSLLGIYDWCCNHQTLLFLFATFKVI
ncbi:MAG: hypothetical protein QXZ02_02525 [Candidatus Bathyarchaeia archaeon]